MKLDKEFLKLQQYIEKMSRMSEKTVAMKHKKVLDELRKILSRLYELLENSNDFELIEEILGVGQRMVLNVLHEIKNKKAS